MSKKESRLTQPFRNLIKYRDISIFVHIYVLCILHILYKCITEIIYDSMLLFFNSYILGDNRVQRHFYLEIM